jgi:hypothetical protein
MPESRSRKSAADKSSILLTGRRCGKRIYVLVNSLLIALTAETMKGLIRLAVARGAQTSGLTTVPCNHIYRLRKAIDGVLSDGVGAALIVNGSGEEYRLAAKCELVVSPCFYELVNRKLLTPEQAERIRSNCRKCTKAELKFVQECD